MGECAQARLKYLRKACVSSAEKELVRSRGQPAVSALTLVVPRGRLGSYLGWLKPAGRKIVIHLITFLRSHSIQSLRVCVEDSRKTNKMSYDSLVNLIDPWAE